MSAEEITNRVLEVIPNYDLIILNYANADMVGHSGLIKPTIKAIETVDTCLERLHTKIKELDGTLIITADHGNSEEMISIYQKTHSTNPVPFIICKEGLNLTDGKLADIAPTILKLLNMDIPKEMTGKVLLTDSRLS